MIRAPKFWPKWKDLRTRSQVPIWIKWFTIPAPKFRSESNDSRSLLQSSDLNQMIHDPCSKVPIWIKWLWIKLFLIHADLNQMIYDPSFQIGTRVYHLFRKWFTNPLLSSNINWKVCTLVLKFQSESNDSRYALRSPDVNQIICDTCSKVLIWIKLFAISNLIVVLQNSDSFWNTMV